MPFDPTLPQAGTEIDAVQMRSQLTGLKDLIDAIPAGPAGDPGPPGPHGPPFSTALVDAVNTVNPGDPATVSAFFDGTNVHFVFGIPRGNNGNDGGQGPAGTNGSNGTNGTDGAPGAPGAQGPPFANAPVDSVTTLNPGDNATVTVFFDGTNVHFQFGIPRGSNGTNGSDGAPGAQGPPGEVSNAQLSSAISGTSNNSNGVATLDTAFVNDPPTLADMELMRAKVNELIQALRRV